MWTANVFFLNGLQAKHAQCVFVCVCVCLCVFECHWRSEIHVYTFCSVLCYCMKPPLLMWSLLECYCSDWHLQTAVTSSTAGVQDNEGSLSLEPVRLSLMNKPLRHFSASTWNINICLITSGCPLADKTPVFSCKTNAYSGISMTGVCCIYSRSSNS